MKNEREKTSEWKECKLGDFANINMGQSPESKYYNANKIGLPFLQGNRTFGRKYPTFDTYCSYPKKIASFGDILFSVRAPVGDINVATEKICIGRGLASIQAKNSQNDFLYFFMHFLKDSIVNTETGSVFGAVNKDNLSSLPILLPPLPEQKAIAEVLSSLDDKIDLLHRQNKTLEAMAEALFRKWFVEEADESWEEGKLGDEFLITMGQSPPGESYNETGLGIPMYQGNADFEFRFPKNRVFTTDPKRFAEKYDTLISVRAPVGAQNMANEKCCIGRGVASLRYKTNSDLYSYTYFKIRYHMLEIAGFNDTGTVFGSIGKDDLWNIKTYIPRSSESIDIDSRLKALNDKVIENCFQIRTLESIRDTLLPKLMSGEVRVKL